MAARVPPWIRGHLFLFDPPPRAACPSVQGYKLLATFLLLEFVLRPLLRAAARGSGVAVHSLSPLLQMAILAAAACALIVLFAGLPLCRLGLYGWRSWSTTERLYLLQVLPITVVVFRFAVRPELHHLGLRRDLWPLAAAIFLQQMLWGFYQELLYRGVLQTYLVHRCGTLPGLLLANLIFTFGPLHAYHFALARSLPAHLLIFAGLFAIGAFFALLYHRSGNLWLVALLHGLGDAIIDGLAQLFRLAS